MARRGRPHGGMSRRGAEPVASWPTLAQARRTSGKPPVHAQKPKQAHGSSTQLPAISATEAHLQMIRSKIAELEQARKVGKVPPALLKKIRADAQMPARGTPLTEVTRLYGGERRLQRETREAPFRESAREDHTPRERERVPHTVSQTFFARSASSPGFREDAECKSLVLFQTKPAVFGALKLGGSFDTLERAAAARRDRTAQAKEGELPTVNRLFEGITWPPGPLQEDMRRAIGKWVRGVLSGPQCRVCLDFLGWPQPFGVEVQATDASGAPLDGALPVLSGMPTADEQGSDEMDYLFGLSVNDAILHAYERCAKLCGEVVYVEQIWLAGRTLARRTFARCLATEHPALATYRSDEISFEAMRQRLVGEGLKPEGGWLRSLLVRKGITGLDEKNPKLANEELEMYHRRQLYLRKELQRQFQILGKEEAYSILGVSPDAPLSPTRLKRTYRQLALACHPDKGGDINRFNRLHAAYTQLASGGAVDDPGRARSIKRSSADVAATRHLVTAVHRHADEAVAQIQRAFIHQNRPTRLREWLEIVASAVKSTKLAGDAACELTAYGQKLLQTDTYRAAIGLPDAVESCASAGEDTQSLANRTEEAIDEVTKSVPTDRRLIQVSQLRVLALALHAGLAATDAGMSASEVSHCVSFAKALEPEKEPDSPVHAPGADKEQEPLGRSPREEKEEAQDTEKEREKEKEKEKEEDKPAAKTKKKDAAAAKEEAVAREQKELVSRVAALNVDLLSLQHKLRNRLTDSSLQATITGKEKVFGLVAAFLDEACLEFAKRLQQKSTLQTCLDHALWWLACDIGGASEGSLAVPPGVQAVVVRSARGLDAVALQRLVANELFPRIHAAVCKLRGRRGTRGGLALMPEDEVVLRENERRILSNLQPRSCQE